MQRYDVFLVCANENMFYNIIYTFILLILLKLRTRLRISASDWSADEAPVEKK
jgi:hypothetical protein